MNSKESFRGPSSSRIHPSFRSQSVSASVTSPPFYNSFGDEDGRQIRVVNESNICNENYSSKSVRQLSKVNLIISSILFLSQLVIAGCLCRPVVIMGGLWVAILVLVQAVLGLHTSQKFKQSLVVGHAWLSGLVCLVCLAAAGYLFSGQMTVACVSTFHRPDHASVVRLYVVDVVSLITSLPCLASAIVCLISTALGARGACPSKPKHHAPFVLYLPRWGERVYGSDQQTIIQSEISNSMSSLPSGSASGTAQGRRERAGTPPPSYNQVTEESFA
ncbi:uncharacterized protein [Palaemon carinicauda]|uniref:uncharacterized protein isoform X2 n=1 Tax=Palaemon carinicauda TaxID=392227 RepID=UPI0035B6AA65